MDNSTVKIEFSIKSIFLIIGTLVSLYVAWQIRTVFFMLIIAFIINASLRPFVDRLEAKKIPRIPSVMIIMFGLISIIFISFITVITSIIVQFTELTRDLPQLVSNVGIIVSNLIDSFSNLFYKLPILENYDNEDIIKTWLLTSISNINLTDFRSLFSGGFSGAFNILKSAGYSFIAVIAVIVMSVYMLIRKDDIYEGPLMFFPIRDRKKYRILLQKVEIKLGYWLRGQLITMFFIGFITWLGLSLPALFFDNYRLHEFALPMGVLAGLLNLVPYFGPFISGFIGVFIAAGLSPLAPLLPMIYVFFLFWIIQEIEANVLVPNIMKKAVGIDPIITMTAVIGAAIVFGVIGSILIVPVIAIIQLVIGYKIEGDKILKE
jgi:predicted PurR-regulated permease PerM